MTIPNQETPVEIPEIRVSGASQATANGQEWSGTATPFAVLSAHEDCLGLRPADRDRWERMTQASQNPYAIYQSPQWWEHLKATVPSNDLGLVILRASERRDTIEGFVPIQVASHNWDFTALKRRWLRLAIPSILMLGNHPLIPPSRRAYDDLFAFLWRAFPRCGAIYLKSIAKGSDCWRYLEESSWQLPGAIVHRDARPRQFHWISLPGSFDEYLRKFNSKQRYNLKREVRRLSERGGAVELLRIETDEQVPAFLDTIGTISRNTWQYRNLGPQPIHHPSQPERLADLARRSILRSYVLRCGQDPVAFVLGHQLHGVFHCVEIGYDQRFSEFSPGSVSLFLVIEDLCRVKPPQTIHFGMGDSDYKRHFSNEHTEDLSVLLLRRTLANRARLMAHESLRSVLRGARYLAGRTEAS